MEKKRKCLYIFAPSKTQGFAKITMKYKHIFFDLDRTLWDFDTNMRLTLEEIFYRQCSIGLSVISTTSLKRSWGTTSGCGITTEKAT